MKKHTTKALRIVSLLVATFALNQAQAAPIAYPAKGQSQAKQQSDDGECYVWAKSNTGIDPAAVATAPAQPAAPHDFEQPPVGEQPQCSKHGSPVAPDTASQVGDGRAGQPVGLRVTPQAHPRQSSRPGQCAHDAVDEAVEHGEPPVVPLATPCVRSPTHAAGRPCL